MNWSNDHWNVCTTNNWKDYSFTLLTKEGVLEVSKIVDIIYEWSLVSYFVLGNSDCSLWVCLSELWSLSSDLCGGGLYN